MCQFLIPSTSVLSVVFSIFVCSVGVQSHKIILFCLKKRFVLQFPIHASCSPVTINAKSTERASWRIGLRRRLLDRQFPAPCRLPDCTSPAHFLHSQIPSSLLWRNTAAKHHCTRHGTSMSNFNFVQDVMPMQYEGQFRNPLVVQQYPAT